MRYKAFSFFAILGVAFSVGLIARMALDREDLVGRIGELELLLGKRISSVREGAFVDADQFIPIEHRSLEHFKKQYLLEKKKFIHADLGAMELTLYENGLASTTFKILTKGREDGLWETPSGHYSVLLKETNHFSSIGQVWMPWSMQFYGNFFIHGWPYYPDGRLVPEGYSGGCIRLSTEDAERIFSFAERGMPILVSDGGLGLTVKPSLVPLKNAPTPLLKAKAAIIYDHDAKETLLKVNEGDALPIASLTKLMTGVVASELIYLERKIPIRESMIATQIQSYKFEIGKYYRAFDLLYPLLMQSSNGAAVALAEFMGMDHFVENMNAKAWALGMEETAYVDPSGVGDGNISTAEDLTKLLNYILEKRSFLLQITKGESDYFKEGKLLLDSIKNLNEFIGYDGLVGVKNGYTTHAKGSLATIWSVSQGAIPRNISIVVLGSEDRAADTKALLDWMTKVYGLNR